MPVQRALLVLLSVAAVGTIAMLLVGFVWPRDSSPPHPETVNLGPLAQFEVGVPSPMRDIVEHDTSRWPVRAVVASHRSGPVGLWVVRLTEEDVRVFLARDPHSGCAIPWRGTFAHNGREGFFRSPCCGSTFTIDGRWVSGESPRDLDWFEAHVEPGGDVVVDLRTLHAGDRHGGVPADERAAALARRIEHTACDA